MKQNSFDAHDNEYRTTSDISWHENFYSENDKDNLFSKMGFEEIFSISSGALDVYVDIGCGAGYLLSKASDYFPSIYGVEPSGAAIKTAKQLNDGLNIEYVNMTMLDGFKFLDFKKPFLATTSAVLSHIPDMEVIEFLRFLRENAPLSSRIYFYEPYGKNIQTNLWHVRRKKWWTVNLEGWNVKFLGIEDSGYLKGIYAEKLASSKAKISSNADFSDGYIGDVFWNLSGLFYKIRYALIGLIRRK
jgi:SAM-dependent methyltransferase